jgi:Icc protein
MALYADQLKRMLTSSGRNGAVIYPIDKLANRSTASQQHPIRLVQMSDMHLFADPEHTLLGLNTEKSFQSIITLIQQEQPAIDLLLTTGDIAQQPHAETYQRFLDAASHLNAPHFCTQGNHDSDQVFGSQVLTNKLPCEVLIDQWCCILLDSSEDHAIAGSFSSETLNYLDEALQRQHDKFVIVALHHNPIAIGCQWLDQHMLRNNDAFLKILAQHHNIKIVLHGHVHQEAAYQHQGIDYFACPATSLQFEPHCNDFSIDRKNPGYRWLDLYPDGTFYTEVSRTTDHVQHIDYESTGY